MWWQNYGFGATANNNGNIQDATLKLPGKPDILTRFGYDGVNRLTLAMENPVSWEAGCVASNSVWCQQFGYDERGNRAVAVEHGLGAQPWRPSAFGTDNRVINSGWVHDGRGNVAQIPYIPGTPDKFVYDAEDHVVAYCKATSGACDTNPGLNRTLYSYDVEGRRVKKEGLGGDAVFVYDAMGQLAAEYGTPSGPTGKLYLTADHLGSTRVITDQNGVAVERHDFEPFGAEVNISVGSPRDGIAGYGVDGAARQKFTAKERDSETGLDYFGARYLSSAMGRFTSPDAPFADQHAEDPQSWNLYTYVRNNPLRYIDSTGMMVDEDEELRRLYPDRHRHFSPENDPCLRFGCLAASDGPTVVGLPKVNRGPLGDRLIGAGKGALNEVLDIAELFGAPESNTGQIRHDLWLYPNSENERFGGDVLGIAALFMGGGKTGRKVNEARYLAASESVELLERVLLRLEQTPNKTPATKSAIRIVEGLLKRAKDAMKKSEPHAIRGQGSRR